MIQGAVWNMFNTALVSLKIKNSFANAVRMARTLNQQLPVSDLKQNIFVETK